MASTRRTFLKRASTAAAGLAGAKLLPASTIDPRLSVDALFGKSIRRYDEAELVACLIRDWLRGGLADRWWWRDVLGSASGFRKGLRSRSRVDGVRFSLCRAR